MKSFNLDMIIQDVLLAFIVVLVIMVWAFNVHSDRTDRQELQITVVEECADADSPKMCAKNVKLALEEL